VTTATEPESAPAPPAWTEYEVAVGFASFVAATVMPRTAPPPTTSVPTATLPISAFVSPDALLIEIEAPAATPPKPAPMESVRTLRVALAVTNTPPPACGIVAPVSMCAHCLASDFMTRTWPP